MGLVEMKAADKGGDMERDSCNDQEQMELYEKEPQYSNEKTLFILHRSSGVAEYSHEFAPDLVDPQLLSGFIGAMASFLSEFVGSEESQWKADYGSDTTLIVETGDWAIGVLAVSRETSELRSKLRIIVAEFEATYAAFRDSPRFEEGVFVPFDDFVMRIFVGDRLNPSSRLARRELNEKTLENADRRVEIEKLRSVLHEPMKLSSVANELEVSIDEAKECALQAYWKGAINIHFVPERRDVLIPSENSLSILLSQGNPLNLSIKTIQVIGAMDGRTTIGSLIESLGDVDAEPVLHELGALISQGLVQMITTEHKLVLTNERILNNFLREICASRISEDTAKELLATVIERGTRIHPWLSRIRIEEGCRVHCLADEYMGPSDLDDMYDALLYVINELSGTLSEEVDEKLVQTALANARNNTSMTTL
jgi:regulator of replication initiation timing